MQAENVEISTANSTLLLDATKGEPLRMLHYGSRLAHGDKVNPVLLNSWEGVYFNINEPGMALMMADIASMGERKRGCTPSEFRELYRKTRIII